MYNNCYIYNEAEDDVTLMARNLETLYKDLLRTMPNEVAFDRMNYFFSFFVIYYCFQEVEIPRPSNKRGPKGNSKKGGPGPRKSTGGSAVARGGSEESTERILDHFHNATVRGPVFLYLLSELITLNKANRNSKIRTSLLSVVTVLL